MNAATDLLELLAGRSAGIAEDRDWRVLLELADRTLTTPALRHSPGLPLWLRQEVEARIAKNVFRRARLIETYQQAAEALRKAGIDSVLLKGFTHEIDAAWDPALRTQCDIDLLCPAEAGEPAQAALLACGFQFHDGSELSDNHRRPMLKPHQWSWKGDYFDPELPVSVELHHTIWSQQRDRVRTPGTEAFWDRRETMHAGGLEVPAFRDADRLGTAALHLLRHVLRNNVRPLHAFELARMLQRRSADHAFWQRWSQHPAELQWLQSIAFQLAALWFHAEMPEPAKAAFAQLPARIHSWFDEFAYAPILGLTHPNKDALWLHLALLPRFWDRAIVARRKLLPGRLPASQQATGSYLGHVATRGRYHALALARALWTGSRSAAQRSTASHTSD
ncbi:MAG: nucleotidyltransferase family protein [Acidobacteriota bacterium]